MVLLQAFEHMQRETSEQIYKMKHDNEFIDVDWTILNEYLPEKIVQEMDVRRKTSIHQRLSITSRSIHLNSPINRRQSSITNENQLLEAPTIMEDQYGASGSHIDQNDTTNNDFALPIFDIRIADNQENKTLHYELMTRLLSALSADYENQWFLGMIRRRTLDILTSSIEKAKTHCSVEVHWKSIIEQLRLSLFLRYLMRFDYISWINKEVEKLLFDHIFLTIELVLGNYCICLKYYILQKISIFQSS